MQFDRYTLFYNGPFCQWASSPMVIDGINYGCAEQYMMAQKAKVFGDHEAYFAIMSTDNPREQKAIGRLVKGYRDEVWHAVARDVVTRASLAKFTSSSRFYWALMRTEGTLLVEASPYDKVWGIGLAENDPRALIRSEWRGTNWLGEVLTEVREQLKKASPLAI